jgi:hypothetical protein
VARANLIIKDFHYLQAQSRIRHPRSPGYNTGNRSRSGRDVPRTCCPSEIWRREFVSVHAAECKRLMMIQDSQLHDHLVTSYLQQLRTLLRDDETVKYLSDQRKFIWIISSGHQLLIKASFRLELSFYRFPLLLSGFPSQSTNPRCRGQDPTETYSRFAQL